MRGDHYGAAIAIEADTAVVGATDIADSCLPLSNTLGAAYVFHRSDGAWTQEAKLQLASDQHIGDGFGGAIALSGPSLAIGADGRDDGATDAGAVYMYEHRGNEWRPTQQLVAHDAHNSAHFGGTVAMEGATLFVGAIGSFRLGLAAYVFRRRGAMWVEDDEFLPDVSGGKLTTFPDGIEADTFISSDPDSNGGDGEVIVREPTGSLVIVGPGLQQARLAETADVVLWFDARAAEVAELDQSVNFAAAHWTPALVGAGESAAVDCEIAEDLADSFVLSVTRANDGLLNVHVESSTVPTSLPRDGLLGYCHGTITPQTALGRVSVPCVGGSVAHVTDTADTEQPTVCEDGEFEILTCRGDCDGNRIVSVDELVTGVRLALGQLVNTCAVFDVNGNGLVSVDELVRATRNALNSPC